jgi:hypothetical protein
MKIMSKLTCQLVLGASLRWCSGNIIDSHSIALGSIPGRSILVVRGARTLAMHVTGKWSLFCTNLTLSAISRPIARRNQKRVKPSLRIHRFLRVLESYPSRPLRTAAQRRPPCGALPKKPSHFYQEVPRARSTARISYYNSVPFTPLPVDLGHAISGGSSGITPPRTEGLVHIKRCIGHY